MRDLLIPAAGLALLVLDAPRVAATACTPANCLTNSAVAQRIIPDTAVTDNAGDSKFFSSSNNALPNVVIVLDNSTSMYELPYDVNPFPNSAWVLKGTTPNMGTGAGAGKLLNDPANLASCHSNTFFEGDPTTTPPTPRFCTDPNSVSCEKTRPAYNPATTYPPTDPSFNTYFDSTKAYKFFEWALSTTTPGGVANNASPTAPTGTPGGGNVTLAAVGIPTAACNAFDGTTLNSGGSTTVNGVTYVMTERQRCQQCINEAGYYIGSGKRTTPTTTDNNSGLIVFSGNWLNYYPPKFLIARKTVTDFIASQPGKPSNQQVRIGIVTYDPNNISSTGIPSATTGLATSTDGGKFVSSGMTPPCGNTWDTTNNTPANATSQVGILVNQVNKITWGNTASAPASEVATPLAETLFNVGQFYGGDNTFYTNKFGTQWLKPGFTAPTDGSKPICAACQVNAIVLITDGQPEGDNNLPQLFRNNTIDCSPPGTAGNPTCGKDLINNSVNLLDDVTNFLATNDLATGNDANFVGTQSVLTYIIGLGLKVPLLDNAARFGKTSSAIRADTSNQILSALQISVASVISRATAFSSTAIQTLEVGTGSTALVPRFIPGDNTTPNWEGHLFRFNLFNEFVAGVDKNGDGNLNGVFLVDADGDIVTEDDQGAFHKETCSGGSCTVVGVANPIWDAGGCPANGGTCNTLANTPAANRRLYTAIWNGTAWQTIAWPTQISDPNFAAVENALNIDGNNACSFIQQRLQTPVSGSKYFTSTGSFDRDHCALAIMDYVRGFNVLNEVAIPTGSTVTDATTLNRAHMLGDIFHSSPVVIGPPVDQFLCSLGLDAQCLSTLYQDALPSNGAVSPTPSESANVTFAGEPKDAYEKYWEDHETRKRIVVVGANDGMLHAFNAGDATTNPPTITEPLQGLRTVTYSDGDGSEVWGFITPDQIPRLWLAMRDGHQTYMDGDIMVRDVWVDGQANDKGAYTNTPGQKEANEFHTIAIASERQGGTHYVALDVTDTTTPKMLWMYPPPCSPEEELWGETWGQFSPRPPPIGPVLLQNASTGPSNYGYAHTEERWVAFLNGGHDAYDTRGRAAAIVDVYTGSPLFVAKYNPSSGDPSDPAKAMRFGFPATASMADWGRTNTFQQDGFFDTAVMGDEGGQIWTFRFGEPGHINTTTGLVDNWTFGRAYEPNTSSTNNANVHNPIYTATSLTVDTNNWLRAYVGTGDRAHVRSLKGGDCRPDDPMTCIQAGCTVSSSLTMDNGPNHLVSTFVSGATATTVGTAGQTQTTTAASCTLGSVNFTFNTSACPAPMAAISETLTFAEDGGTGFTQADGGIDGGNIETAMGAPSDQIRDAGVPAPLSSYTGANDFVSVVVEGAGVVPASAPTTTVSRLMSLPSEADAYDTGRFDFFGTNADLVDVTNASATSTAVSGNKAPPNGAGWIMRYVINNTVPVVNADGTTTAVPASIDEKTVTSASIQGGCVLWSTLIPFANGGGTLGCASAGSSVAPFYQADAFTGAPNCATSFLGYNGSGTNYVRFIPRNVISPPPEPSPAVAVGAGGSGVRFSTLEIQPGGSEVTQMTVGTSNDILQMVYSLPLTSDQHTCRHVDATKCE